MKLLLASCVVSLFVSVVPAIAWAQADCGCCENKIEHCVTEVREVCITLKYQPRCIAFAHRKLAPLTSCACPVEQPCTCHKPLKPLEPCAVVVSPEPVCHKPLTPAYPEPACGCINECGCAG